MVAEQRTIRRMRLIIPSFQRCTTSPHNCPLTDQVNLGHRLNIETRQKYPHRLTQVVTCSNGADHSNNARTDQTIFANEAPRVQASPRNHSRWHLPWYAGRFRTETLIVRERIANWKTKNQVSSHITGITIANFYSRGFCRYLCSHDANFAFPYMDEVYKQTS